MSPSGELVSTVGATAAAVVLNEGNPKEISSSQGETLESSADTTPTKEPERPKLWSEFSDDEDPIDTDLAREQLRKVCLASVGVRPCDVPAISSASLHRTKTSRYAASSNHGSSPTYGGTQNRSRQQPRRSNNHFGSGACNSQRGRRQDSLAVWQEAATKSRAKGPMASTEPSMTASPTSSPLSSTTKRRFGGLSFDVLVGNQKREGNADASERLSVVENPIVEEKVECPTPAFPAPEADEKSCLVNDEVPAPGDLISSEPTSTMKRATPFPKERGSEPGKLSDTKRISDDGKKPGGGSEDASVVPKPEQSPRAATVNRNYSSTMHNDKPRPMMESSESTCSSTSVYVPRVSRSGLGESSSDEDSNYDGPIEPRLREVDGDVIFDEKFDIWFTQPLSGSRRGLAKEVYENGMHLIGSFDTLSQFFEFHGMLEWDELPPSSVIAFCRHGVKPIWEDPANELGGRYLVKNFRREDTEAVFTKMALGFLSGMLHDWKNYNLISLHVRESRRGNDIQLWRSKLHAPRLTSQRVKADLQDFVENSQPSMTLSFVPNRESLSRNDSRLQQQSGHRRSKGGQKQRGGGGGHRGSNCGVATTVYTGGSGHPVFQLYSQKGSTRTFLGEEQKAAYARESEAELLTATPHKNAPPPPAISLSLTSDDRLTSCGGDDSGFSPVSSEDSGIPTSFKRSDLDSMNGSSSVSKGCENRDQDVEDQDVPVTEDELAGLGSFRTRNSTAAEAAAAYSSSSAPLPTDYAPYYLPPDVAMYYPAPPPAPFNPYGYGYYMAPHQSGGPSPTNGSWYDAAPRQGYWAPNCAPPDTFCLTPYSYPPYVYTSKGTTYYAMPSVADAEQDSSAAVQVASATPAEDSISATVEKARDRGELPCCFQPPSMTTEMEASLPTVSP